MYHHPMKEVESQQCMSPAGIWKVISHEDGLSPQAQKHVLLIKRKVQKITKILRTISLNDTLKGVPSPRKGPDRLFI